MHSCIPPTNSSSSTVSYTAHFQQLVTLTLMFVRLFLPRSFTPPGSPHISQSKSEWSAITIDGVNVNRDLDCDMWGHDFEIWRLRRQNWGGFRFHFHFRFHLNLRLVFYFRFRFRFRFYFHFHLNLYFVLYFRFHFHFHFHLNLHLVFYFRFHFHFHFYFHFNLKLSQKRSTAEAVYYPSKAMRPSSRRRMPLTMILRRSEILPHIAAGKSNKWIANNKSEWSPWEVTFITYSLRSNISKGNKELMQLEK
jgi:hypothetical protein